MLKKNKTKSVKAKQSKKTIAAKKPSREVRIMAFGTFDMIHPGHIHFFKQARKLAGTNSAFLIVSLARDKNVKRIKGKLPRHNEKTRHSKISELKEIDKAVLGALGDHIPHIVKHQPQVIALGYDQVAYVKGLRSRLKEAGLNTKIVRLKAFKPTKYKTSLLQK